MHTQSRDSVRSRQSKQADTWSKQSSDKQIEMVKTKDLKIRKGFNSVMQLESYNKVILNDQARSLEDFMMDLSVPNPTKGSYDNSYMMIEVSDVDITAGPSKQNSSNRRRSTKLGGGGGDYDLNLKLPLGKVTSGRYTGMGKPGSIVQKARAELETMQKTSLPRSRMSVEGLRPQAKGMPMMQGGKLSIGLPTISHDAKNLATSKSMATANPNESFGRISLYKNDEERQSFMKQVNE